MTPPPRRTNKMPLVCQLCGHLCERDRAEYSKASWLAPTASGDAVVTRPVWRCTAWLGCAFRRAATPPVSRVPLAPSQESTAGPVSAVPQASNNAPAGSQARQAS